MHHVEGIRPSAWGCHCPIAIGVSFLILVPGLAFIYYGLLLIDIQFISIQYYASIVCGDLAVENFSNLVVLCYVSINFDL